MKKIMLMSAAFILVGCGQSDPTARETSVESSPVDMATHDFFDGAWSAEDAAPILEKTMYLHLGFDRTGLTDGEEKAAKELLAAGARFHSLYLDQRHPQARAVETALLAAPEHRALNDLFRMMKGPIATTLDNQRAAFLNVEAEAPAKNVYPHGVTREVFDDYLAAHPDAQDTLLDLRAVVREASAENIQEALKTLDAYPALETLHPGMRERIEKADTYFALPYSIAYAEDIYFIYDRLNAAAGYVENDDPAFARFLRLRGRDLLSDDYDGGDATWVTGDFTGNLNVQLGSYETYDDALYGVKSFFSLSLLKRDKAKSEELSAAISDIQAIEDALPYGARKKVRSNIPVGIYDVVADFGQSRGTNTATILPNEGHLSRQFGRTILIRSNILTNQEIYEEKLNAFKAATLEVHHDDFALEGNFYRTLWHEVGHYLGPDQTVRGNDIDGALQDTADLMEEMKADLVSLFSAPRLREAGFYTDAQLRAIYAGGILRVLQKNQPRRSQAYQTMQLIQWNWFLDKGVLALEEGGLRIDYERYPEAVSSLLEQVIDLQYRGDRAAAAAFVDRWTQWDDTLHGEVARRMTQAEGARFRLVTYEALGEAPRR